ncbi:unnamed protein product [Aspergillus oryzae]|uniref:Unnamed protein product n=2 Tax=Aspergillus oryzae TaxID=5062 RepID=A0AAN5C2A9_ASPOZ|nr:unnamed protein product [Aspergillus oryzae]GMF89331.1 unnamed protein product [Aspergillus oryzae]GMG11111.1 unnamed protein product [Aspergillus oryzae]GMG34906.1 unnamed protein product [Aspergillus oryzae]GMG52497.1 unnamed protein product [Aspergillus oryzae var. brunneus]
MAPTTTTKTQTVQTPVRAVPSALGPLDNSADLEEKKDLKELSSLGHFLKGSSATLGLTKVKDACEEIQNYGAGKDKTGTNPITEEDSLKKIDESLATCQADYKVVEKSLRKFFGVENDSEKNVDK